MGRTVFVSLIIEKRRRRAGAATVVLGVVVVVESGDRDGAGTSYSSLSTSFVRGRDKVTRRRHPAKLRSREKGSLAKER